MREALQKLTVRQWVLLRMLCARRYGMTVKEMAEESGVSEKTIRRDLATFQQAGFPLQEVVEDFGRKKWSMDHDKAEPGLTFAFDEAIALYASTTVPLSDSEPACIDRVITYLSIPSFKGRHQTYPHDRRCAGRER